MSITTAAGATYGNLAKDVYVSLTFWLSYSLSSDIKTGSFVNKNIIWSYSFFGLLVMFH